LLTVPIAIAVNIGRVTLLGIIHLINPEYATGDFHIFMGMVMLGPALILFMLVGWILGYFIGENEPEGQKLTKSQGKTT
jgi:exosortase/archaeosortase family protein